MKNFNRLHLQAVLFCPKFNELRLTLLNIIKIVNYLYTFSNPLYPHGYPHTVSVKSGVFLSKTAANVEINVDKSKNLCGYLVNINLICLALWKQKYNLYTP